MSVLPLLLKFAKPKCGGSGFPKPDSGGDWGGSGPTYRAQGVCLF